LVSQNDGVVALPAKLYQAVVVLHRAPTRRLSQLQAFRMESWAPWVSCCFHPASLSHGCRFFPGKPRHLWPSCAALADRPALELVLADPSGNVSGHAGHCVTAFPASNLNAGDAGREQLIGAGHKNAGAIVVSSEAKIPQSLHG